MKFFQKTSVAVLLTLLVVALCCVLGYTRAGAGHGQGVSAPPAQQAGESGMNYFLNWIDDGANLFTMETTDTMARDNLSLNKHLRLPAGRPHHLFPGGVRTLRPMPKTSSRRWNWGAWTCSW